VRSESMEFTAPLSQSVHMDVLKEPSIDRNVRSVIHAI